MFISADQLVAHAIGDYLVQSNWMANEKTKRSVAAFVHVVTYAACFWLYAKLPGVTFSPSWQALTWIAGTHFLIDRWRLARYIIWLKNMIAPWRLVNSTYFLYTNWNTPWSACKATGYPNNVPPFMAVWLMIIADNILHALCNAFALYAF